MDLSVWITFFAASWAIGVSPGPGAVAATGAGLNHRFARGYLVSVGLILGILSQVLVSLGLGAVIATSALAFTLVKWLGVAYRVFIGLQQWRAPTVPVVSAGGAAQARRASPARAARLADQHRQPETTAFLLAVVPQFLDLSRPLAPQYAVIGAAVAFTDMVVMAGYTAMASKLLRLFRSPRQTRLMNRTFGSPFIAAGLLLAMFKRT